MKYLSLVVLVVVLLAGCDSKKRYTFNNIYGPSVIDTTVVRDTIYVPTPTPAPNPDPCGCNHIKKHSKKESCRKKCRK